MTTNKIPVANITRGATPVITIDDEALQFVNPNEVLIKDPSNLNKFLTKSPFGSGFGLGEEWPRVGNTNGDAPSLSDILNVTIVKYYDSITKLPKARAILKIRNSSENATEVAGVDARIHDPSNIE
jgi:hypothetical protein